MRQMEVVCGILYRQEQVYIAKRKGAHAAGVWEFPGGKVEAGESGEQAVVRELAEELNIAAQVRSYLGDTMDEQEGMRIHVRAYLCTTAQEPHDLNAHSEGRWVHYTQAARYAFQEADHVLLKRLEEVMTCWKKHPK